MKKQFELLRITRENILKTVEGLSVVQLNQIPDGFNNNIVWNLAHLVATQQLLVYGLSGKAIQVSQELINKNRKGTKPEETYTEELLEEIKTLLQTTVEQMEKHYESDHFSGDFKVYPTSYGVTLNSVEEAIAFNNLHEGVHFGTIKAIKALV
ncbi:MAG: DinB family protein [Bacteroidota bacterium]